MRLALTIDSLTDDAAYWVDGPTARYLDDIAGTDVLLLRADTFSAGFVGTARLRSVEAAPQSDGHRALFELVRRFPVELSVATSPVFVPRLQFFDQPQFDRILFRAALSSEAEGAHRGRGFSESQAGFLVDPGDLPRFSAVARTVWAHAGGQCALTGEAVAVDTAPSVICPSGPDRLHVNNMLLLSPAAEAAFRAGHFSVRDDFSVLLDAARIDPELHERTDPGGRLFVPDNTALRPAAENLAWHRRFIFGLD